MKRIRVEYTMEIDNDDFDKYCNTFRIGKQEAVIKFRSCAEAVGRVEVYNRIKAILKGDKDEA